jgi:CubicO group peptidase (beta-lactamase class C family)
MKQMKPRFLGAAAVCLWMSVAGWAQSADRSAVKERLDTIAKSYSDGHAFMGAVLVVDGDQTLLDKGYGMAEVEWSVPDSPDARFRICSLTKQFTAALVLLLQQDGKLRIEEPVAKYLPDVPKSWEKVTLVDLLQHSSGIPEITRDKGIEAWSMSAHTPAEEMALVRDKPLDFEPGIQASYSNSNYLVLGLVIEKLSGEKYGDLLRERILGPLGMRSTGLDLDDAVIAKSARGYRPGKEGFVPARSMSMTVPWAAGSMYSTTGDLLLWERGLFGGRILNEASLKAMTTAGKGGWGLGVEVGRRDGVEVVRHGGGMQGFNAQLSYVPERKIGVVVLSNVEGTVTATMGEQLLDFAMGKPVVLASERRAVPIAPGELAKFVGVYDVAPGFAVTIAVGGESLTAQGTNQSRGMPLMFQGVVDGHARFYLAKMDAEIEFVPAADGVVTSLVLHQGGEHVAKKR